jgi:hypothetical protein
MGSFGSLWNAVWLLPLGLALSCGDAKPRADSPTGSHKGEITDPGAGGSPGVPPLDSVDPADHDIEVPPAP